MILHVSITQEDINEGACGEAFACAGAIAITRAFREQAGVTPVHEMVSVTMESVGLFANQRDASGYIFTPPDLSSFVSRYDDDRLSAFPVEFDLDVPDRLIAKLKEDIDAVGRAS